MRALRWCWIVAFGGGVLALVADVGRTQPQLGNNAGLLKAYNEAMVRRGDIVKTGFKAEDLKASDKKVADDLAKFFLYRITHRNSLDPAKVQAEFEKFIGNADKKNSEGYQAFIDKYLGPALVANMKDVLAVDLKENPSIYINACMMLPTMARLRTDDVAEYLMGLVNDNQSTDIARLHALRSLKEYMPIQVFSLANDVGVKPREARRIRDGKIVDTLTKYIDRPVKVAGWYKEQVAVVHFFRREAIQSLAGAGAPAVLINKKGGVVEAPIAPTLLRVLANQVEPPPTLQEKIEAAVGLCSMKYNNMPEYVPDVAVYLVGRTVSEVVSEYNKDLLNISAKGKDRKLPTIAWKTESRRLEQGVKDLKANAAAANVKTGADRLEDIAVKGILKKIQIYEQPTLDSVFDLNKDVPKMQPSSGAVFKIVKGAVIDLK